MPIEEGPDELDRRIGREDAAKLLLEATDAFATGATILGDDPLARHQGVVAGSGATKAGDQLSALALVTEQSKVGQYLLAQQHRHDSFDNQTRWTLIDSGKSANIILEIDELSEDRYVMWHGAVSFQYPQDRLALFVAARTGWLALAVGDPKQRDPIGGMDHPKSLMGLELSTHGQLQKMLKIMDDRNPEVERLTVEAIWSKVTGKPYRPTTEFFMGDVLGTILPNWGKQQKGDLEVVRKLLVETGKPFGGAVAIYETFAFAYAGLHREQWRTAHEIAERLELNAQTVERSLIGIFQSDNPWVSAQVDADGQWTFRLSLESAKSFPDPPEDADLLTKRGREAMARTLLKELNIEMPIGEVSPAIAMMHEIQATEAAAEAYLALIRRKAPVWAGARGFAMAYEESVRRAKVFRELRMESDELTVLACQIGCSMTEAHVLTVGASQVEALPTLSEREGLAFLRGTPLPFDPFFIDFTGESRVPSFSVAFAREGNAKLIGCLLSTGTDDEDEGPQVLYATPIMVYSSIDSDATGAIALGSLALNLTGNPKQKLWWVGSSQEFLDDAVVVLADSPYLRSSPYLADAYQDAISRMVGSAFGILHLLDYSNIEMVEKPLERRERKRVEKRGWDIPLVVRVSRPSRRVINGTSEGMDARDFSHQFDVIGHPKHFTKGPMVRCLVCQGKTGEIECPRCRGTGLDPEKVRPCTRIDVTTGKLTCPNGCRRIWCPPHVKGPEDKPYVPKVRKLT